MGQALSSGPVAGNHLFEDGEICFGGANPEFCLASIGKPMPLYDGSFMGEVQGFKVRVHAACTALLASESRSLTACVLSRSPSGCR